ncbi:hypothetical protein PFISCL1PPCAC_4529, partial [Pristionchus fissidentatus]
CNICYCRLSNMATADDYLGTSNELNLITARGSATFNKDFRDPEVVQEYSGQYICAQHRNELSLKWHDTHATKHFTRSNDGKFKCSYPDNYHGDKRPVIAKLNAPSSSVTFEEAKSVMALDKILLHVGLPVCPHHKDMLKEAVGRNAELEATLASAVGPLRSGND